MDKQEQNTTDRQTDKNKLRKQESGKNSKK